MDGAGPRPHTPVRQVSISLANAARGDWRCATVVAQFEWQISAASSRWPRFHQRGLGDLACTALQSARDPSLRLKSGFARDDTTKEQMV